MKLALFGVGNAGTRIVDRLVAAEARMSHSFTDGNVLAFNTTQSTFDAVEYIDDERQILVGDTHPDVVAASSEEQAETDPERREGVAGDPELGASVARDDLPEIRRALDMVDDTEVDAAVIVAGLGGGTGCGVGGVLLEELQSIYEIPVYVLGVLPASEESDQRAWTAGRAIRTFVPQADALVSVDNDAWPTDANGDDAYEEVNEAIVTRITALFAAGEGDSPPLSELRMDPNDIKRTLAVGGIATVGYAETELDVESEPWLRKFRRLLGFKTPDAESQTDAMTIKQLVKQALESKLTLPCDITTADRVLLVLSGPPAELSRKGFETGQKLLEDETGTVEILAGDEPRDDATTITATVLLSNVTGVSRIEAIQQRAVAFQREHDGHPADDHGFEFQRDNAVDEPAEASSASDQPTETSATKDENPQEQ